MSGLSAREGALVLIRSVTEEGAMLDEAALPAALAPAERARALTLARGVIRWLGPIDATLAHFMKRAAAKDTHAILRLGATEILALREAPHGVVDSAVRLAKAGKRTRPLAGLVNAVLRRVTAEGPEVWETLDHARLGAPDWLWRALRADWGRVGAAAIAAAHLRPAPLDLTPKNDDAAALATQLGGVATPTGSVRLARPGRLTDLPGFATGDWWAQDAAAAVPARLAGSGEGRRALDLCAAPGGKTMQLAAAGWVVTALDAAATRMKRVEENLARTGLSAELIVADALEWAADPFDLVLLDAPCTATGTIRRHPELPHIRDGAGLPAATTLQARLIDAAWALVAPGGALIYATCSLIKAEGESRANAFMKAHPEAERAPIHPAEIGDAALLTSAGDFRARPDLWPESGGLDGFFATRFRRRA
ncbi:RsmB/NOP family class I SAM-dependent RNA methyltransferase [Pikeienuella piscinae]|uniref:RsmB/NOP family class I SAM-dependent RNA methyltransferase n=1 Tax=Pikeienuella piscinae TaxID=2748098 RepID=UPI001FE7EA0E|nr:transcription antitermination factor NusB [Pikeienuella piscinae]